ncbi:MAG: SGNH/GDSL hydrolase family protein [Alphaproteobacteria bacterium]
MKLSKFIGKSVPLVCLVVAAMVAIMSFTTPAMAQDKAEMEARDDGIYLWRGKPIGKAQYDILNYFDLNPASPGSTIMYGGTLMAAIPWAEIFPNAPIRSYTTFFANIAFLYMQVPQIVDVSPRHLIIMTGEGAATSLENGTQGLISYQRVLERLRRDTPRTKLSVVTIPVSATDKNVEAVQSFNARLRRLAAAYGAEIIDLEKEMLAAEESGKLFLYRPNSFLLGSEGIQILSRMVAPYIGECRICL